MAVQRKDDETVVFSWIIWPSRKVRDEGMKKVMADPRLRPANIWRLCPTSGLVMTSQWTVGGEPEEAGNISRLEFHFEPIDIGTKLTLTHAQLKTEASPRQSRAQLDRRARQADAPPLLCVRPGRRPSGARTLAVPSGRRNTTMSHFIGVGEKP
jgi:hypothetical protein